VKWARFAGHGGAFAGELQSVFSLNGSSCDAASSGPSVMSVRFANPSGVNLGREVRFVRSHRALAEPARRSPYSAWAPKCSSQQERPRLRGPSKARDGPRTRDLRLGKPLGGFGRIGLTKATWLNNALSTPLRSGARTPPRGSRCCQPTRSPRFFVSPGLMPETVTRTRTSSDPGDGSAISPTASTSAAGPGRSYHAASITTRYPPRRPARHGSGAASPFAWQRA
jgi:hypothetical protein